MDVFLYTFESTGHGRDEIADAFAGIGEVTGGGSGVNGSNWDLELPDGAMSAQAVLARLRAALKPFSLPQSTIVVIDGDEYPWASPLPGPKLALQRHLVHHAATQRRQVDVQFTQPPLAGSHVAALRFLVSTLCLGDEFDFLLQEAATHLAGQPQRANQRPGRPADLADRPLRIFPPATSGAPSPGTDD